MFNCGIVSAKPYVHLFKDEPVINRSDTGSDSIFSGDPFIQFQMFQTGTIFQKFMDINTWRTHPWKSDFDGFNLVQQLLFSADLRYGVHSAIEMQLVDEFTATILELIKPRTEMLWKNVHSPNLECLVVGLFCDVLIDRLFNALARYAKCHQLFQREPIKPIEKAVRIQLKNIWPRFCMDGRHLVTFAVYAAHFGSVTGMTQNIYMGIAMNHSDDCFYE